MCEYCSRHGAGKKWYLEARNYLKNYESNDQKRYNFVKDFAKMFMDRYDHYLKTGDINRILNTDDPNWIKKQFYKWYFLNKHSGQVIPAEEAKMIMELAGQISLVPCVCRMANSGKKQNLCMLFMAVPDDVWGASHISKIRDIETLSIEESQEKIKEFSESGLVQTVWTFHSPHIGAICNCDYPFCTAIRFRRHSGIQQSLFKAEYIAQIKAPSCSNCKKCIAHCQFGAISYSSSSDKTFINPLQCFGCGVCRFACTKDAIELIPRESDPITRDSW
ncbi:MAG: 4Fe-4S dicluster domain-containing protein [Candidatus Kariarchaeaceae archaeon]